MGDFCMLRANGMCARLNSSDVVYSDLIFPQVMFTLSRSVAPLHLMNSPPAITPSIMLQVHSDTHTNLSIPP